MRRTLRLALATLVCVSGAAQASVGTGVAGKTFRIDDTGTSVMNPALTMQWKAMGSHGPANIVSGTTQVNVELAVAPWIGHAGRIYMTLPQTTGPLTRATWTSGGVFLPGTLLSGGRGLVYAGPITTPMLHDLLQLRIEADGAHLTSARPLAFGFEIEVDQ
jgi:hypothetical protein